MIPIRFALIILSLFIGIRFERISSTPNDAEHFTTNINADSSKIFERQFQLMKNEFIKYSEWKKNGNWQSIPQIKQKLQIGDSSAVIVRIKKFLKLTEDFNSDNLSNVYDESLSEAIKKFQNRTGLKESGKLTADVLHEMNVSLDSRIRQIAINMERCKKTPQIIKSECLIVNIPDFRIYVFENDTPRWNMKIVVGRYKNKTAVFNGEISKIVFCPYWNVPKSIMQKEILPVLKRNPNFLKSQRMEWHGSGIRQLPGPSNALGLIKFIFPNSYSIYLHDTPAKTLFENQQRAFSHGCIRLQDAKKLATYLLRNDREWNEEKINRSMNNGVEQVVTLTRPIQVVITYLTCWVDLSGKLQFRKDIYNKD